MLRSVAPVIRCALRGVLLLAAAGGPASAHAQDGPGRRLIGTTSVGTPTPVYVETRSTSRSGDIVTAAIRVALVPPLKHPKGELRTSRTLGLYDCAKRTVATKESWYYLDSAGKQEGMHREVKIPGFGPAGKGSVADVALTWVCANVR